MKNLFVSLFVSLVMFSGTLVSAQAADPQVNLSSQANDVKVLKASVVIDAPPAMVWQVLTDYNSLKNFMPGYEKSRVIAGSGTAKTLDIGMKVSRLMPAFNYQARVQENKSNMAITIQRISGDFKSFNASYKMTPVQGGNKTQLVYNLTLDLGPGVPTFGADGVLKSSTEKSLAAVQSQCAQAYRKSLVAAAK